MTNRSAYLLDVNRQCREIVLRDVCSQSYSEKDKKWVLCHVEVSPKLQGKLPRCGLSALSMAAEMLLKVGQNHCTKEVSICEQDQTCDLDVLLTLARLRGFTCQGELFSAENVAQIAKESYKYNTNVVNDGFANINMVISELLRGSAVLVPYDADRNHAPCMDNGHKAHWALLTGVLCELDNDGFDWTKCKQNTDVPILFHAIPSPELGYYGNPQHIYFCCKQGKSRHTAVWSLDSLKKSNENLLELDPTKERQVGKYVFPKGGIKAGLCSKIVIISNQNKS